MWSEGDPHAVAGFYAPTFRLNGEEETVAEFAKGVATWRAHFEGFTADVDKLFTCGDVVVSRTIYRGRHVGDFRTVPATGKMIEASGIDIFEFEGSRVVDHWHEADHFEMFQQLGAEPRPAERGV